MLLFGKRGVFAAWALGAIAGMASFAAPASAQSAAESSCPATAPIDAWARRNNYVNMADGGDIVCGDFTGDGAPDAIVFLTSAEEWTGNSLPPYGVFLFRNVGGRLQHLRTLSTPDDMKIFGVGYEDTRIERGRITLVHQTLEPEDSRCCPTGVTAFTINTETGRVTERLLRRMDEAEQQRLVDRTNAANAAAEAPPARQELPVAIMPPPAWTVQQAGAASYAFSRTGFAAMPELSLSCLPNRRVQFGISLPHHTANALTLQLMTPDGRSVTLDRGWRRHPSGSWFILVDGPLIDLLSGGADSARVALNGRFAGTISLRGSHAAIRRALSPCWAWPPMPVRG